jgi:hypothetical protein
MSERQQIHVHIDRVVSDQPLDEGALRAAIAAELSERLADTGSHGHSEPTTVGRTGRQVADHVIGRLSSASGRGANR